MGNLLFNKYTNLKTGNTISTLSVFKILSIICLFSLVELKWKIICCTKYLGSKDVPLLLQY